MEARKSARRMYTARIQYAIDHMNGLYIPRRAAEAAWRHVSVHVMDTNP
jgi:hypothetical protein